MALEPGARLDAYEIVRPLGSGGMGEVWLATEVRLGRKVALKVLPADLTRDPSRVQRFEQEARAASALNHPNVCTIHALGETSDGQHYIAMEYVEGETLRQRLSTARLTIREALDLAIQVAAALSAAHTAGIVHRDIKPENVMLRPDGVVKVLDFGLAKLAAAASAGTATRTELGVHTDPGKVVGTAAYMSPEQARGQEVDARTDIWSLGVLLYEMVAGRSPFTAPSGTEVLAAILDRDPAPLARFDPDIQPELQRIVTKALRKDRNQRYQTTQDLLLDFQALRDGLHAEARAGSVTPVTKAGGWSLVSRPRRGIRMAVSATMLIGTCVLVMWWLNQRDDSADAARVQRNLTRLTFDAGLQTHATWAPDGRALAFASDRAGNFDIWVQAVGGGEPVQLTRAPGQDTEPSWSPDGSRIVFRRDNAGLFIVSALGGPERQLTSSGSHPSWTPDGADILFRTSELEAAGLHAVSSDGGERPHDILGPFLRGGEWDWIGSHPDGRISALGRHPQSGSGFFTLSRDGEQVIRSKLTPGLPLSFGSRSRQGTRVVRFAWNATGNTLYIEALVNEVRNIWRVEVEPRTLEWQSAERLTAGQGADVGAVVSPDGTRMVFTTERNASRLWLFPFDATVGRLTGDGRPVTDEEGGVNHSALSPDGETVAYTKRRPGSRNVDLWTIHVASGIHELVAQNVIRACWSHDGNSLAYSLFRLESREWALAVRELTGPERLLSQWSSQSALLPTDWTADGSNILGSYYSPILGAGRLALWSSSQSSTKPERILKGVGDASLSRGHFSRDGKWLAFMVRRYAENGLEVMVEPVGVTSTPSTRIAADHAVPRFPKWAPDGRTLYFVSRHSTPFFNLWGIRMDSVRGRPIDEPFMITNFTSPGFGISSDLETDAGISGHRALLTMVTVTGNIWMLDNVDK